MGQINRDNSFLAIFMDDFFLIAAQLIFMSGKTLNGIHHK